MNRQNSHEPAFHAVDDHESLRRAVEILTAAFHDDPVMDWVCGAGISRQHLFEFVLPQFVPHGLTYVDPQGRGAAAWLGPGQALEWRYRVADIVKIIRGSGVSSLFKLLVSGSKLEKYHPREPHYYLFAIGARPECKGQGVGTALISHVLRTCDREEMPAYLENSKEENLQFYQGHGFRVSEKIRITSSAPPLWLMWREPRPSPMSEGV